jgi:hypothetical protein
VRHLAGGIKVDVGPLQRGVRVRSAIIVLHGVAVRLRPPRPVSALHFHVFCARVVC